VGLYTQWPVARWVLQEFVLFRPSINAVINAEDIEWKQVRTLCASRVRKGYIFSAKFNGQGELCLMLLAAELFEYRSSATVRDNHPI
jgi:hypothetical protein